MRTIQINRLKKYVGSMALYGVAIDGQKVGDIGNGKSLAFLVDENEHVLTMLDPIFNFKNLSASVRIPAGREDYMFNVYQKMSGRYVFEQVLLPGIGPR